MVTILFMFIIFSCHCAVYMYKIRILQKPLRQLPPNFTLILLLKVCLNDHAPLTVMPYVIFFFKIRMIFSLVAMTGLEKCCITSAYL